MRTKLVTLSIAVMAIVSFAIQSCKKDATSVKVPTLDSESVYVVCEGNFGNGDGALFLYQPSKDSIYGDIFNAVNHQPLGDVFQTMTRIGNYLFLCVNNSDKIVVINADNWSYSGSINIPKPDYILAISTTKAYVSTLYSNIVYAINPLTLQVTDTINMPFQNPQGMALYNNKAYICTADSGCNKLYAIDVTTDKISDSIKLNCAAPQEVLLDKEQKLWVLSGDPFNGKTPAFSRIDPSSKTVLGTYFFAATANPLRATFNPAKDTIYFVDIDYAGGTSDNGIFRMSINDTKVPSTAFIQAPSGQYLYAVGVDPIKGSIYVGDPKGFTQKGAVSVYKPDGTQISTFNVGIGPGHFYFDVK